MPQSEDGKKIYKIGIAPTFERMSVGVGEAFSGGAKFVWFLTERTVQGFAGMLMGAISPKHLAGPIFIFTEAGKSAEQGADSFLSFIVFLSVTLAILNLLPIPILDGGHLLFFIIEALTGSPLSIRVREISSQVGALMLLLLILVSVGNDVMRLVSG